MKENCFKLALAKALAKFLISTLGNWHRLFYFAPHRIIHYKESKLSSEVNVFLDS